MKESKGIRLSALEKQFILIQLIEGINSHYGRNRFGKPTIDYAKNGICKGDL